MDSQNRQTIVSLIVAVVILACVAYAIVFIRERTDSQVIVGLIGLAGAVVVASFNYRAAKGKETDARLFAEKQKVYGELITTIFSIFQPATLRKKPSKELEVAQKLEEIRRDLIVWGSFETIKCVDSLSIQGGEQQTDPLGWGLKRLASLFSAIRKDLGHRDPDGAGLEIAVGMIKGEEREGIRKALKM